MLNWENNSLVKNICFRICYTNLWRVKPLCIGLDDLMQECWIVYHTCVDKYSDVEDAQFVALLKSSINNMINDLSVKASKYNEAHEYFEDLETDSVFDLEKEADFRIKMELAPQIIRDVITFLSTTDVKRKGWSKNKMLKKLFGYNNLIQVTKDYIKG